MLRRGSKLWVAVSVLSAFMVISWSPHAAGSEAQSTANRGVIVKFKEGTDVRLRGGKFVSLSGQSLIGVENALARQPGAKPARLFSRSETALASDKARAEGRSGKRLQDLNLFYDIDLPNGADPQALVADLKGVPSVQNAYLEPLPAPPPVTPDFESEQGYLDAAPDGIGARIAWQIPGGRGADVRIADVEYCWNLTHEDLSKVKASKIVLASGDTQNCPTFSNDPDGMQHGTSVMGELVADNNGFGVTGIVSDADVRLAPASTANNGYNVADAISRGTGAVSPGDLLLVEQQTQGANGGCDASGQTGCVAVEFNDAEFAAIQTATALGVVVVEAAGNGSEDLDDSSYDGSNFRDDSGAIIVGAGAAPGSAQPARSKLGFSTFGSRVDVQGWGNAIVTTGYGDRYGANANEFYTSGFGGTSGASPIVTGAAAAIQGTRLARGVAPLSPAAMRTLLKTTGTPQQDDGCTVADCPIGPLPNIAAALTTDMRLTKTDAPDPVVAGELLTYTLTAFNDGPNFAPNVVVVDTLPAGVSYVVDTDSCVQAPVGTLTCSLGGIAAGASTTFSIQVEVSPAGAPKTLTNTATVSSALADPNSSNNTASAITIVREQADLRVTKECKPDQPNKQPAGVETFCEIYVDNLGPSDARNVVISDRIIAGPAPVTITGITSSSTSGPPATCPATPIGPTSGTTIVCNDTLLPAGARDTIRVTFVADDTTDVDDTASVASDTPDPDTSNNAAVGRVSFVANADLSLAKTAPATAIAGTNFSYSFTVANAGPSPAANVVLKDTLPAGISIVSVAPGAGNSCTPGVPGDASQPLTCNLGSIANGASEVVGLTVKVLASTPKATILLNNANVSSSATDPNTGNNNASTSTTVDTAADLSITKTSDADQYKPNTTITYHVTVANNGPSDAQNVQVVDTLPEMKQAVYQSDTGGCIFQAPKTLTCSMGTIASGASKDFYVYVSVKGAQGDVINSVTVSSATSDPDPANNTATKTVSVKGGGKP